MMLELNEKEQELVVRSLRKALVELREEAHHARGETQHRIRQEEAAMDQLLDRLVAR